MIHNYLIIGGTSKAGTTSLYHYLADHPKICASNMKETRFFINEDYPLPAKYRVKDGFDKYQLFFNHCTGQPIRLDVTPAYLYAEGAAREIRDALPNVKIIFILRDPSERLFSIYRFAKQNRALDGSVSFDDFIKMQYDDPDAKNPVIHLRELQQGCYSKYLMRYFKIFAADQLKVLPYSQLRNNPSGLLQEITNFVGINSDFYANYDFRVFHQTQPVRSSFIHGLYVKFRRKTRMAVHDKKTLNLTLHLLKEKLEPIYLRLNKNTAVRERISEDAQQFLSRYYQAELTAVREITRIADFNW